MLQGVKDFFSPLMGPINKLRKYLSDRTLITDLVCKLVITFGVVLIIGGLYLMLTDPGTSQAVESVVSSVAWVPGIPFYIGNLSNLSSSTVGLVSWIVGLDLLLVGLGLWVRHKLARFTALAIFALAALVQFLQFLFSGVVGTPSSVLEIVVDGMLVYFLFTRFDSLQPPTKQFVG